MRVSEIARLARQRGATSFLQKRGYALPAIAVGLQVPGAIADAIQRYEDIEHSMNRAAGEPLDPSVAEKRADWGALLSGMAGAKPSAPKAAPIYAGKPAPTGWATPPGPSKGQIGSAIGGQLLMSMLSTLAKGPAEGISERLKGVFAPKPPGVFQTMQSTAVESLGKSVGEAGAGLVRDIASKALSLVGGIGDQSARTAIIQALKAEDPILAEADDKALMEAYHTMVRFAPMLSTDKNAVRSFLRQAVMSGSGPDYASIKLLADSEHAVTGGGKV